MKMRYKLKPRKRVETKKNLGICNIHLLPRKVKSKIHSTNFSKAFITVTNMKRYVLPNFVKKIWNNIFPL